MEITIIAAIITGVCTIVAAIITAIVAIYQIKTNKNKVKENEISDKRDEYISIPTPKHPTLLNPDEYDIEDENFIITLGALFQQSRNSKDVTIKKINKEE